MHHAIVAFFFYLEKQKSHMVEGSWQLAAHIFIAYECLAGKLKATQWLLMIAKCLIGAGSSLLVLSFWIPLNYLLTVCLKAIRLRPRCDVWLTAPWQAGGHFIWRQIRREVGGGGWRQRTEEDGSVGTMRMEKNRGFGCTAGWKLADQCGQLTERWATPSFLAFEETESLFWGINLHCSVSCPKI